MIRDNIFLANNRDPEKDIHSINDNQVEKSFSWYGSICFESLMVMLQSKVEEVVGKPLFPVYSYARIYYNDAIMHPHIDRSLGPAASITIETDGADWELWMEGFDGKQNALVLPVGDMVVYQGDKCKHWRNNYTGKKQIQAFFFYVEQDGPNVHLKYDKRPMLGAPGFKYQ